MTLSTELEPINDGDIPDTDEPSTPKLHEYPDQFLERLQRIKSGLEIIGTMGIATTVHTYPENGSDAVFKGLVFFDKNRKYAYGLNPTGTQAYRTQIEDPNRPEGYAYRLAPILQQDGYIGNLQTIVQAASKDNGIREEAYAALTERVDEYKQDQAWIDAGRNSAQTLIQSIGL